MIKTFARLLNLCYFSSIAIGVYSKPLSLFSFHPLLMSGVWVLVSEGLFAYQVKKVKGGSEGKKNQIPRSVLIDTHATYMFMACLAAVIGASIIYTVKEEQGKGHLLTDHGFAGAMVATFLILQLIGGGVVRNLGWGSKLNWQAHAYGGLLLIGGIFGTSWLHVGHEKAWLVRSMAKDYPIVQSIGSLSLALSGLLLLISFYTK